jgi:tetratricopeptide (TPR) repeat protein
MLASYGASLIRQQRYAEAVVPLEAAVKINPDSGDAWASLAFAHSRTEDYQGVLDDLTQRKKYLPENASSYFLWGLAYDKLRRYKEALQNYQLFLAAAGGKFPDQEFQVRHRVVVLKQK